jgi:arabinose-5-phosphate isomerase
MQMALGDARPWPLEARGFSRQDFFVYHPGGKLARSSRRSSIMHRGAELPLIGWTRYFRTSSR